MRTIKKFLATALTMAMCVTMIGTANVSAATKVKLNKTKVTIQVGRSVKLKVKGTKVKVKWLTSNKKVAVVKKGKVTGKKAGKAVITAKVGKKAYKCKVTVKKAVKEQETTKPVETVKPAAPATVNPVVKPTTPTETTKPEETTTPEIEEKLSQDGMIYYDLNHKTKTCTIQNYYLSYDNTEIAIPEEIDGYKVTKINENCVVRNHMDKLVIPSSVVEIEDNAFFAYIEKDNFINNSSLDAEANNYWGAVVYDTIDETGSMYFRDGKLVRFVKAFYDEVGEPITEEKTEVTITSDIKGYASDAFYNFGQEIELDKLTVNEDVTDIQADAFKGVILPNKNSLVNNSNLDAEENDYWGIRFIDE